jgi:hypothetical protein
VKLPLPIHLMNGAVHPRDWANPTVINPSRVRK